MKQFSSFSPDTSQETRRWLFGQRRQSERRPSSLTVRVTRHRDETASDHLAVNVSNGGMMLQPAVVGYVGEHIFLTADPLFANIEARINHQYGDATGIAFVQRVDRPTLQSRQRTELSRQAGTPVSAGKPAAAFE